MIASQSRTRRLYRPGFTLLEVLVVVAILVILASVAGIAVFSFLDEAKENKATLDMQALETAYRAISLQSAGEIGPNNFDLSMLIPKITQGQAGLIDPWNNPYQFRFVQSSDTGEDRIQFFTFNPKTNVEIVWPRR
jgi:general secretion pathway protein G